MSAAIFIEVAIIQQSGSGNSFKIRFTKDVHVNELVFLSVNDVKKLLNEKWFACRLYRLNETKNPVKSQQSTPIDKTIDKLEMKLADPSILSMKLNLFEC